MCADAVQSMHSTGGRVQAATFSEAMRAHVALSSRIPFTSDAGRFDALEGALAKAGYPEVVCLQEAAALVESEAEAPKALRQRYVIFRARRETLLLLRRDDGMHLDGVEVPEAAWRPQLEADGGRLAWDLKDDWSANLDKTVVVSRQTHHGGLVSTRTRTRTRTLPLSSRPPSPPPRRICASVRRLYSLLTKLVTPHAPLLHPCVCACAAHR